MMVWLLSFDSSIEYHIHTNIPWTHGTKSQCNQRIPLKVNCGDLTDSHILSSASKHNSDLKVSKSTCLQKGHPYSNFSEMVDGDTLLDLTQWECRPYKRWKKVVYAFSWYYHCPVHHTTSLGIFDSLLGRLCSRRDTKATG